MRAGLCRPSRLLGLSNTPGGPRGRIAVGAARDVRAEIHGKPRRESELLPAGEAFNQVGLDSTILRISPAGRSLTGHSPASGLSTCPGCSGRQRTVVSEAGRAQDQIPVRRAGQTIDIEYAPETHVVVLVSCEDFALSADRIGHTGICDLESRRDLPQSTSVLTVRNPMNG